MARWAELVFHVLAHVRATAGLAPSVYDARWIGLVEREIGPASARCLAEDAEVLGRAATTHHALAELQLLAWLFEDVSRAAACADRPLDQLGEGDVDDPSVLPWVRRADRVAAAEVLRAAAELEADAYARLPPPEAEPLALGRVLAVAPWLASFRVEQLRPLRIRGRVRGDRIFVGVPCRTLGPSAEHVGWQAAHEATVAMVHRRAREAGLAVEHAPLEHTALVLLHERAISLDEREAHARWIGHFANVPPLARETLKAEWRALLSR